MEFEQTPSGRWSVCADWLEEPIVENTYHEAYWKARRGI